MKEYKSKLQEYKLKSIPSDFNKVKISNSLDAYKYVKQFYSEDIDIYESFFLLLTNRSNNTTGYVKISQGGIVGTVVDIQLIAKYAIESLSKGVILIHNHPSGQVSPSDNDIIFTKNVIKALLMFEIKVLDHLIISKTEFYSFADEGIL